MPNFTTNFFTSASSLMPLDRYYRKFIIDQRTNTIYQQMVLKRTSPRARAYVSATCLHAFEPGDLCCPSGSALFGHARSNSGACCRPTPRGKSSPIHEGADWSEICKPRLSRCPRRRRSGSRERGNVTCYCTYAVPHRRRRMSFISSR
jgi:hypothetical protein